MKILNYILALGLLFPLASSCSDDFLEVEPKGQFLSSSYYNTEDQVYSGLVSVYDILRKNTGGFENMVALLNSGSDDHVAGGGGATDGIQLQRFSTHDLSSTTVGASYWDDHYEGIFRANVMIQKLPEAPVSDALKARYTAEVKALRALYYFNLVRLFRNIPLITEPLTQDQYNTITQVDPGEIYGLIEADLKAAIPNLPDVIPLDTEAGRITKGAATALLGKALLQQGKNSEAAAQLALVNGTPGTPSPYGYELLSNFEDLWVVDNKFNSESILEVAHTNKGESHWGIWGSGADEGNTLNVMVGPRGYSKISEDAPEIPSGWSFNVFTQKFYDIMAGDPRFEATILDLKTMKENGEVDYIAGYEDTGYFLNKFTPTIAVEHTGAGDAVLNYRQNSYIIRLADTYLMEAEALGGTGARAQALLDAVRARVGLPSVPVSPDAIALERRKELAGEGHRFFDLVRTGKAAEALSDRGFDTGVDEILPIPFKELENTQLVQNPGYN
ncbi:RagB/SusD family nutrient uptake outer membrane protein [Robertkochia marina]|uniref:RagB/SusD family nutrient uptake outer membrane protein n=1 Tax=Robertkochia marina TaxID=1227945 RepID=A0A4S3M377_9FLAO|nr:RagB/SusD family nutrient uptake outer membrane protein [Robertkochia marina]THD69546.1 RagB/SusD family nutrient uptake outer membrane protein [Robertkochia marina]TRZ47196.1 RagB/SusD family nutrient uptake outer membrane protein [Robertkochia marina]